MIARLYGMSIYSFVRKLPNCLPKRLYHFQFPPSVSDSTGCCTSSQVFGLVSALDFTHSKKEMSSHSSILAWEIPWTEEPGGLQAVGSHRVRHDLVTKQQ